MGRLRVLQVHLPLQRLGYFLLLLPCFDGLCSYLAVSHRCPRINPPFSSGSICAHPSVVARYARFLTSCVRNASHWAPRLIFSFSFLRVSVPVSTALSSRISLPRSCFSLLSSSIFFLSTALSSRFSSPPSASCCWYVFSVLLSFLDLPRTILPPPTASEYDNQSNRILHHIHNPLKSLSFT